MDFRGEHYFAASAERLRQAKEVLTDGNFALSMYCSGLAVECMLRAYQSLVSREFEGRHDLTQLLQSSRLVQSCQKGMERAGAEFEELSNVGRSIRAAISITHRFWHNNYRFASESRLLSHLKRGGLLPRTRRSDNPLKGAALTLLDAATTVVSYGTGQWTYAKK